MSNRGFATYAPGVLYEESDTSIHFKGRAESLVAAGVVKHEWIPGQLDNAKSMTSIVLDAEGSGVVQPRNTRRNPDGTEFGSVYITKSGSLFHVLRCKSKKDREAAEAMRNSACARETWQISKDLHREERHFPSEWKQALTGETKRIEDLVKGRMVYSGFPDIDLSDIDRKAILDAIDNLKEAISSSTPFVKKAAQTNGNVISLADRAHSGLRATG